MELRRGGGQGQVLRDGDFGLGGNGRDALLGLAAMILAAKSDGAMRQFAMGAGGGAVWSLVRRNILTAV